MTNNFHKTSVELGYECSIIPPILKILWNLNETMSALGLVLQNLTMEYGMNQSGIQRMYTQLELQHQKNKLKMKEF